MLLGCQDGSKRGTGARLRGLNSVGVFRIHAVARGRRRQRRVDEFITIFLESLLLVGSIMSMEVIGTTEAFATTRKGASMRALSRVYQHMTLQMFESFKAPTTSRIVTSMLILLHRSFSRGSSFIRERHCSLLVLLLLLLLL